MKNRGFTLIELLVVISIMSVLSTVVMASLNQSKIKSQEAAIKSDLQSIRTQAELSYGKVGDYYSVSAEIAPILAHINANGGIAIFYSLYPDRWSFKMEDTNHFAVSVRLKSDTTKNWSVSDAGNVVWDTTNSPIGSPQSMNWTNAKATCESYGKRLPTIEELKSLYNIAPSFFQPAGFYWSGSNYQPTYFNYAYTLASGNGGVGADDKINPTFSHPFRCVK